MPGCQELLRALIKETLKLSDVELSKQQPRSDVDNHGVGQSVRVELNGKSWLTRSQAEVDRVLRDGGKVIKGGKR